MDPDAPGGPGSVSQVRDGALRAQLLAKDLGIATLLIGHVTKDGSLAGPRTLEHVVDTVLSFEGDRHHALRMLRALKHRFGPTDELGLMEMTGDGLLPVTDPSALFLADRRVGASGSVVAGVLEGTRPLCVEVQALVVDTPAPMPRRVAQSFDGGRMRKSEWCCRVRCRATSSRARRLARECCSGEFIAKRPKGNDEKAGFGGYPSLEIHSAMSWKSFVRSPASRDLGLRKVICYELIAISSDTRGLTAVCAVG